MFAPTKKGGFNMVNIKDFFHPLKNNWIRKYIHGLDDHWADLLDEQLKCDTNSRDKLLKMGAEHPRVNKIISSELPSLSGFFKSFKRLNKVFNGDKEAEDNRWISSSIFYNPTILRRKGPSKKCSSPMEMLIPNHFGLKEENSWRMDVKSMFSNSQFISQDDFNLKFGTTINILNYMSLKKLWNPI